MQSMPGGADENQFPGALPQAESEVRKVSVGRLEPDFTMEILREHFSRRFGKVSDVFLANGKKFGFVTFESGQVAKEALDAGSLEIDGVNVVVKSADPMKSSGNGGGSSRDSEQAPSPTPGGYGAAFGAAYSPYGGYGGAPPGFAPAYGGPGGYY